MAACHGHRLTPSKKSKSRDLLYLNQQQVEDELEVSCFYKSVSMAFFVLNIRPSPFFFVYRRMRFLISGRSVGLKKKSLKKIISILGIAALVPQHNSCGARKTTTLSVAEGCCKILRQRGEKDQPPKLLCYIKWLKNVVSFFCFVFFFGFGNAKNLGRSDDVKRRKKRGWPNTLIFEFPSFNFA